MNHILKYIFSLLGVMACSATLHAQDIEKEFETFVKQQQQAFDDFRNKANAEFDTFLRETWKQYEAFAPIVAPTRPEPPIPVQYEEPKKKLPPVVVKPIALQMPKKEPYRPSPITIPVIKPKPDVVIRRTPISFYGTPLDVDVEILKEFTLAGNSESDIADAWKALCTKEYEQLVQDCLQIKQQKRLNDWAYLLFTKQIGVKLFGAEAADKIAFLQMFLLNQSGYKTRLAKIDDKLKLLIATTDVIYAAPYLTLSGDRYYVFEPQQGASMQIRTYPQNFAEARNLVNLQIDAEPEFSMQDYERTFTSKDGTVTVSVTVNRNLTDFYLDYPQCDVLLHYNTPIGQELRTPLYAQLQTQLAGKSQKDAANMLIHFVQTAFDYKTDGEQFGYEKPFFPEETFYYPYCDCEDRAMLFSTLVKELLGLDAVLLDYPNHIASAVRFTEDISGDYVLLPDGSKYLICDPTYIGAPIGMCMDEYKTTAPKIIR